MNDSILVSIKKLLGGESDYDHFDPDLILHINSAFAVLTQLGVGPVNGFSITDETETWQDFLGDNLSKLENVKTYVYLKVKLVFDPPQSSAVLSSFEKQASELEWRLNVAVED